jgi:hypothetical protein
MDVVGSFAGKRDRCTNFPQFRTCGPQLVLAKKHQGDALDSQ